MIRKLGWVSMTVLEVFVALYSGASLLVPTARTPFVQNLFDAANPVISWIDWVPKLLLVESFILARGHRGSSAGV